MTDNPWIDIPIIAALIVIAVVMYLVTCWVINTNEDERQRNEARWYGGMSALAEHARTAKTPTPGFQEIADAVNRGSE